MNRPIDTRSVLVAVALLGMLAADGSAQSATIDIAGEQQAQDVRELWLYELSLIKRDMQRPCCRLEQSHDRVVNIHSLIHPADKTPVDVAFLSRERFFVVKLRTEYAL